MNYKTKILKKGIKLHFIKTNKFKTNLVSLILTVPLDRKTITQNTIIPAVLKRGTKKLETQELISIELEKMYGADFDCGVEKLR